MIRPLVEELPWRDPAVCFAPFAGDPWAALLEGGDLPVPENRYAYLCVRPYRTLTAAATPAEGGPNPFDLLEQTLAIARLQLWPELPPFQGGVVGFLAYECGAWLERLPSPRPVTPALPGLAAAAYDLVVAFDRQQRRCWLCSSGLPETAPQARATRARERLAALRAQLLALPAPEPTQVAAAVDWQPDLTQAQFEARVGQVLAHIRAGDIFQANFTTGFRADWPAGRSPWGVYRQLQRLSPEPFSAYLAAAGHWLLSASPERFLRLDAEGRVETRPIKGTRPRDRDPRRDAALAADLQASLKDRAENVMIVDLLRNDLGRVCEVGSIRVPALFLLESFAHVHHLTSQVVGQLRPGLGPVDLLRATFPGGSITGAPKIRSIEIIRDLEVTARGAYCGSLFWIGFDGAMDASILIRTLQVGQGQVRAQAGCGIVADSDPTAEYEEMITKVAPLLRTLGG